MRTEQEAKQKLFTDIATSMSVRGKNGGPAYSPMGIMFGYKFTADLYNYTVKSLMTHPAMRVWRRLNCTGLLTDLQEIWDLQPPLRWGKELNRVADRHGLQRIP